MGPQRAPREEVAHMVGLYHRGIICPTEMWVSITRALTPANTTGVLDSLPPDAKEQLRAVYLERPPAVYIERPPMAPADPDYRSICVQVVRWCEESEDPLRSHPGADGMIHVKVEDGVVREWRPEDERAISSEGRAP
jgi:hypothetical protein